MNEMGIHPIQLLLKYWLFCYFLVFSYAARLPPYQSPLYARQGAVAVSLSHTCLLSTIIIYLLLSGR